MVLVQRQLNGSNGCGWRLFQMRQLTDRFIYGVNGSFRHDRLGNPQEGALVRGYVSYAAPQFRRYVSYTGSQFRGYVSYAGSQFSQCIQKDFEEKKSVMRVMMTSMPQSVE